MATPFPFTTGQVLTAAQMNSITELIINDKTDSYTLVAGDAGEYVVMNKATATTITVPNNVFTASQIVRIVNKGAGVCTVTAGAGTSVSSTGTLALAQNATGTLIALSASAFIFEAGGVTASPGALAVVKAETSFSASASVTADNVFTSTYTNYLLTIRASTTGNDNLNFRLRASGTSAATNYNYQQAQFDSSTSYINRSTSQTSFQILNATNGAIAFTSVWLSGPQLAALTDIGTNQIHNYTASTPAVAFYYGNHSTATSYDGFELLTPGTTTGTYTVYGYAKS